MKVSRIGDYLKQVLPNGWGEQTSLAHRAGITPEALNKILSGATKEPGFETIAKIARAAMLDMNRVIAETDGNAIITANVSADLLRLADRKRLVDIGHTMSGHAAWLLGRFGSEEEMRAAAEDENVLDFVPHRARHVKEVDEGEYHFPVPPDQFKQRDFDYPRPYHYWKSDEPIDDLPAAAAGPRGVENAHLLNPRGGDVREVIDRFNQIIRVEGDSMEDRYFHDDLVRVDTRNRSPQRGEPIAVYCDDLGGSLLGFFKPEGDRVVLVKKNKRYGDVTLPPNGWLLIGPVVELVRRVERRERV